MQRSWKGGEVGGVSLAIKLCTEISVQRLTAFGASCLLRAGQQHTQNATDTLRAISIPLIGDGANI